MSNRNYFRSKAGKTEIETREENKSVIWLAWINTILYWIVRLVIVINGPCLVKEVIALISYIVHRSAKN